MKTIKILLVAGARPNFMKLAPIIQALRKRYAFFKPRSVKLEYAVVHTGQHYDRNMSETFLRELGIPVSRFSLRVGSGSHAVQTAKIMVGFEKVLVRYRPAMVVVLGDVNSTLACALVTAKMQYVGKDHCARPLLAHVEAGLRSFDRTMPEEINRILVDSLSDLLFTTCKEANINLAREGIRKEKVFFTGNVMIDALVASLPKIKKSGILQQLNLLPKTYALLTLHRPSNVDDADTLGKILDALKKISAHIPIVFPVHPRTARRIGRQALKDAGGRIMLMEPLGYLDFMQLCRDSRFVLTDSGGVQEETTFLGIPCLTMRDNTERPITVSVGTNKLVGNNPETIVKESISVLRSGGGKMAIPELWDGKAAGRIVNIMLRNLLK
jgi:UDP-N-acetylglucosamine 2-epimerase (non-hydrolysing)